MGIALETSLHCVTLSLPRLKARAPPSYVPRVATVSENYTHKSVQFQFTATLSVPNPEPHQKAMKPRLLR